MKKLFLTSLSLLTLVGAGCVGSVSYDKANETNKPNVVVNDVRTNEENTVQKDEGEEYAALNCNEGLKLYQSAMHNVEFCYPENDGRGGVVTVKDVTDGVEILVDGEAERKVWVVGIDPSVAPEDIVGAYMLTDRADVTCFVAKSSYVSEGVTRYVIEGKDTSGQQGLDSVGACTYRAADEREGFDMNSLRSGGFHIYEQTPETMLILTGEQDASLGEMSGGFTSSLRPQR